MKINVLCNRLMRNPLVSNPDASSDGSVEKVSLEMLASGRPCSPLEEHSKGRAPKESERSFCRQSDAQSGD